MFRVGGLRNPWWCHINLKPVPNSSSTSEDAIRIWGFKNSILHSNLIKKASEDFEVRKTKEFEKYPFTNY